VVDDSTVVVVFRDGDDDDDGDGDEQHFVGFVGFVVVWIRCSGSLFHPWIDYNDDADDAQ